MGRTKVVLIAGIPVSIDLDEVHDDYALRILGSGMDLEDRYRARGSKFVDPNAGEEEIHPPTLMLPMEVFENLVDQVQRRNRGRIPAWLREAIQEVARGSSNWTAYRLYAKLYGRIRNTNWYLDQDGMHAVALPGASLWELAEALTGDGANWPLLGFKGNPRLLVVGTRVEVHRWVMRVAGEIRYKGEDTDGGARRRQGLWDDFIGWPWPVEGDKVTTNINRPLRLEERGPAADGQESLLVRRARERHWKLEGATATAEAGATLPGLADAITGNPDDYKLLGFNGDPTRLRVGDKVDIMPLLDKAAGVSTVPQDLEEMARQRLPAEASPPAGLEKGEYLGMFRITVYNTAREWDHPAAPTRKVPGLDREYGTAFLKDIDMQGSGIDREGRLIQHTWANRRISGYKYLNTIRTASGEPVQPGWSVAVDKAFVPPGTWIYIDNVGWRKAVDTGGKIQQRKIDVYFAVPRKEAYALDKQEQRVWRAK